MVRLQGRVEALQPFCIVGNALALGKGALCPGLGDDTEEQAEEDQVDQFHSVMNPRGASVADYSNFPALISAEMLVIRVCNWLNALLADSLYRDSC